MQRAISLQRGLTVLQGTMFEVEEDDTRPPQTEGLDLAELKASMLVEVNRAGRWCPGLLDYKHKELRSLFVLDHGGQ